MHINIYLLQELEMACISQCESEKFTETVSPELNRILQLMSLFH